MTDQPDGLVTALADRYTIVREIGAGGMARVYLAEDLKHRRKVALKVLRPALAAILGPGRFLREIEIAAGLNHPNILPLHDSGAANGFLYYVMPYIDGETLREKLEREKQLGVNEAVRIASAVASALDFAHRQDIIHRDIKPENILLHDGQPVVSDFGIALAVTAAGGTRLTETGLSLGTPQYMSPEQATGEREITPKSDVYSLGAVLYEMLVGDPPHTGNTVQAIVAKVVSAEPHPISDVRPGIPRNVVAAVQKALAKVPADRFHRATEFAEALSNPAFTLRTIATSAEPSHAITALQRSVYGLAALATVLFVIALWGWLRESAVEPIRVYSLELQVGASFALAPDGSRVAYGDDGIFIRDLADLQPRPLMATGHDPFFSPDGSSVGFFAGQPKLTMFRVSSEGGTPTPVTEELIPDAARMGAAWSSDGFIYFTANRTSGLFRVPVSGGEAWEEVTRVDRASGEVSHRHPEVLPGGRSVVYTSWWGDSARIMVHSFETGEAARVAAGSSAQYHPDGYLVIGSQTGTLEAIEFDADGVVRGRGTTSIAQGIAVGHRVRFDLTNDGTLLYQPSYRESRSVVLVDTVGRTSPLLEDSAQSWSPRMSHDGSRIAISREAVDASQIWVHSLERGRWPVETTGYHYSPVWSPDDEYLAYSTETATGFSVFVRRSDGSGEAKLVFQPDSGFNSGPSQWLPDGRILIGTLPPSGVWVIPADGSGEAQRLVDDAYSGYISPNGRYIVYDHIVPAWQVYVAEVADPVPTRVPVSVDGGRSPQWSVDGGEIYYVHTTSDGRRQMMAATIQVGERLRILGRRMIFDASLINGGWSVDPLRRGFVVLTGNQAPPPNVIVLNFAEKLKTAMGN